jgi:hypothetical protein
MRIIQHSLFLLILLISLSVSLKAQWEKIDTKTEFRFFYQYYNFKGRVIGLYLNNNAYMSNDDGKTWSNLTGNLTDSLKDKRISTIGFHKTEIIASTRNQGLFYSSDFGQSWYKKGNRFNNDTIVAQIKSNGNILLAGTYPAAAFVSFDNGVTWKKIGDKFLYFNFIRKSYENMRSIYEVGFYKNEIFVAGSMAFYHTSNYGKDWLKNNMLPFDTDSLEIDFHQILQKNDTLFASTYTIGVVYSTDNGNSWYSCNMTIDGINSFIVPNIFIQNNLLFAATQYTSVIMSKDNGNSWYSLKANLPFNSTFGISVSGDYIIVSSVGAIDNPYTGVYRAKLSDLLEITNIEDNNITNTQINISPNPATDYIDVILSERSEAKNPDLSVKIYDVLGVCVQTHPPAPSREGERIRLDVSGLAAGVYFVRVGGRMYKFVKM